MKRRNRRKRSRWVRIVRNLLLALVLAGVIWLDQGAPLFSQEEQFLRVQREAMFTRTVPLQGVLDLDDMIWGVGANDTHLLFGWLENWQSNLVVLGQSNLVLWPRQGDGPALAPEPNAYYSISSMGPFGGWLVAADAPAGPASAVLTARLAGWYVMEGNDQHRRVDLYPDRDRDWPEGSTPAYWEKTYRIQGEPLGEGAFGFYLEAEDPYRGHIEIYAVREAMSWQLYQRTLHLEYISIQSQMTAVFYDAAGAELGRAELRDSRSRGT